MKQNTLLLDNDSFYNVKIHVVWNECMPSQGCQDCLDCLIHNTVQWGYAWLGRTTQHGSVVHRRYLLWNCSEDIRKPEVPKPEVTPTPNFPLRTWTCKTAISYTAQRNIRYEDFFAVNPVLTSYRYSSYNVIIRLPIHISRYSCTGSNILLPIPIPEFSRICF